MRIGHCQYESVPGDFEGNLSKVVSGLQRADQERVQIVCFPECFLTGYQDTEAEVRASAFAADSPQLMTFLDRVSRFQATAIVGYNELRGPDLYNTAIVVTKGHILGSYSKCSAYMPFHKQGREFPVFERDGVKFGVVICSDGGFIEPTRILALKGAKIIFSPHYNYIGKDQLLRHFTDVRSDHIARAIENRVWFVRGNNVTPGGHDPAIRGYDGVGYGDSYIVDPSGEILVRSRRHQEDFIFADVDPKLAEDKVWSIGRSRWSAREFGKALLAAAEQGDGGK
jgi:predicted amidohydrolase